MSFRILILCCGLLFLTVLGAYGQAIKGEVIDMETHRPMTDVLITNIHTGLGMESNTGSFFINASGGQLLEFKKAGYKTARVRIPDGAIPPYFKIIMQKGPIEMPNIDLYANLPPYKRDSLIYRELYKHELDFAKLTPLQMIQHPFSAMSKRNREIWAFQDSYARHQQEKYVDFIFNEKLVARITGLSGDSVQLYMHRYRPSYEELRSMNEYTFYTFIKRSVEQYRRSMRATPRSAQ